LFVAEAGMEKNGREKDDMHRSGLRWMGAGIEFCGVISVFCYIGYKLDKFFNTGGPFLLITGFFISFIGMLYLFYKESK
jgi:F0F1-type ATP synthase assembly protein I